MSSSTSLFPSNQPDNSDNIDSLALLDSKNSLKINTGNSFALKLSLVTSIAAAASFIPGSSQAAYAAARGNEHASREQNQALTANFKATSDSQLLNLSTASDLESEQDTSSALLPRIIDLITLPFQTKVASLSGIKPLDNELEQQEIAPLPSLQHSDERSHVELASNIKSPIVNLNSIVHQVESGDTVRQIAQDYQVDFDQLVKLNQLENSNLIDVDQQLKIPAKTQPLATKSDQKRLNLEQDRILTAAIPTTKDLVDINAPLDYLETTSDASEDPYIAQLRREIEEMRAEHDHQHNHEVIRVKKTKFSALTPLNVLKKTYLAMDTSSKIQANKAQKIATSIPAKPEAKSSLLDEEAISLQLPPLSSSEEYLPNAFDGYVWPAQGALTSGYGWRWGRLHGGIDIAAPIGTPIYAAASGKVIYAGWNSGGYGNLVKLQHLDGSTTLYAHNNRILVSNGQRVNQGDQISEMGNTGRSTGSHLHFEIHQKSRGKINPLALLRR